MDGTTAECSNCGNRAREAVKHTLEITKRDGTTTDVAIPLCETCLESLLALDWVTRVEPVPVDER